MNFCPLCANTLLIEKSGGVYEFICRTCSYYYPLMKSKDVITYSKMAKDETIHDISMQKDN